jgi:hypothetical protein
MSFSETLKNLANSITKTLSPTQNYSPYIPTKTTTPVNYSPYIPTQTIPETKTSTPAISPTIQKAQEIIKKKTPMTFPVGEGMSKEATAKAYQAITKPREEQKVSVADVIKEVPKATVTVAKKIGNVAKSIQEGIARSGASTALTLMTPFGGPEELKDEDLDPDIRKAKDIIFGKDPLKSLQTRIAESEVRIKSGETKIPLTNKSLKDITGKKLALPLSILGVGLSTALDFTGAGGEKNVIKLLAKTEKFEDVAKILRQVGVAEDLIEPYGKLIAKTSKIEDVSKAIDKINDIQKTTKTVSKTGDEILKTLSQEPITPKSVIPKAKPTDSLFIAKPKERQFLQSVTDIEPNVPLKVGSQYIPRGTDELAIKAKNLIKDDLVTAERIARTGTDDVSVATASELIKKYSDEASKTSDNVIKNVLYEKASDIAHITATNLTEQGRSIQAASIMGRLTPEGILKFAAKEINKYNEAIEKSKGLFGLKTKIPNLTPEQIEDLLKQFNAIQLMGDGTEKAMAFKKLNDAIAGLVPSSLYQKAISVWKAGLLTGLKTSGVNTMSNLWHGTSEIVKDIPAVVVDSVAKLFTGKRTLGLTTKGTIKGTKEGFNKGWRFLKTGYDERNVLTKLDYTKVNFGKGKIAKAIQGYEESIFKLMGAEDQPFYYGAKARSLQSQAIAQAKNAKLKGKEAKEFIDKLVSNPTDDMLKYAITDAETAVFQNKTVLGEAAKKIQKIGGGAGEIIVPFGRTPAAVATQLINYSPVGIVKTIIENIGKGKFDQRLFSQGIGRGITGTAVMAIGSALAAKGLINTSYPTGEREQKLWELEGRTANSIKIGGKWRNVNIFGPAGMVLVAGAYYQQTLKETGSMTSAVLASASGGVKSLKEQTFLQGVSSLLDAIDNPEGYAKGFASNLVSSLVPTIIGDVSKSIDVEQRRTPGIVDPLLAKIPGVRQSLEPKINVLGKEVKRGGNWMETMADPSRPSKELSTPIIQELRRLYDIGFPVSPTLLGDKQGYKTLKPKENTALWKRTGEIIDSKLNNLLITEEYKNLADDEKAKTIDSIIDKSKIVSRAQAVMELTNELSGQKLKDKLSELKSTGLMTRDVYNKFLELSQ